MCSAPCHAGRRSGPQYRTVLGVVGLTGEEVIVIAGLGRSSDWFRNLRASSSAYVEVGKVGFATEYRVLGPAEAAAVVAA